VGIDDVVVIVVLIVEVVSVVAINVEVIKFDDKFDDKEPMVCVTLVDVFV
jgi:hypothetical protein